MAQGNVESIKRDDPPVSRDGGDGGGGGNDGRLREVEKNLAELTTTVAVLAEKLGHLATKEDIAGIREALKNVATKEDIARIKERLESAATKEQVSNVKVWVLSIGLSILTTLVFTGAVFVARMLIAP